MADETVRATGLARHLWRAVLVVALLVPPLFLALPRGGEEQTWVYILANLVGAAVVLGSPRLHRTSGGSPWYLLGLGLVVWLVANIVAFADRFVGEEGIGFPSPADAFYLAAPLLLVAGVAGIVRRQDGGGGAFALLDSAIITIAGCLLSWAFILDPIIHAAGVTPLMRVTAAAYPATDLLLLAMLARLLVTPAIRIPSYWFLASALVIQIVADTVYAIGSQTGELVAGGVFDTGWPVAILLVAMAASHPSMRSLNRPIEDRGHSRRYRLLSLVASAMVFPLTFVLEPDADHASILALLGSAMFLLVFVRMRQLLKIVQAAQVERGRILDRLFGAGEGERIRLAGEIHDGPVQRLTAVGFHIELATRRLRDGDVTAAGAVLEQVKGSLGQEIQTLRGLMSELRPPALDQNGLEDALRDELERFRSDTGIEIELDIRLERRVDLETETILYRSAQEALTNVAKHARASKVRISLVQLRDFVSLRVQDDGIGFSPSAFDRAQGGEHFGLLAMTERLRLAGGEARVDSAPGRGTTIEVRLPVNESDPLVAAAGAGS